MKNQFDLTGRVALVTGGGGGIGREIVRLFAAYGADIAIADINASAAAEAAVEVRSIGRQAIAIQTDVTKSVEVDDMVHQAVAALGKIDILVANAGICINTPAEETSDEDWLRVINLNLNGVFWCCRAVGRHMIGRGTGSIVNIASMSGTVVNRPQPQAAYNASKAAVMHLTKSLAIEWVDKGIRVNSVSPGYTSTELTKRGLNTDNWGEIWMDMTPMKRLATPEEVAYAALYLASDAASYCTGTDLILDGGYSSW
ncbi:MAG: glucose 1-dehydrogenase [Anaerolineae bacterium]|nr:glucose 1-dehydrogenase [Anaerolineae bacterium]